MTLPAHFLRRFVAKAGIRLPKTKSPDEVAGVCPVCKTPVFRTKLVDMTQLQGVFRDGLYYHHACQPGSYHPGTAFNIIPAIVRATEYPKGNLQPEEYRFWVGYRAKPADSKWAMCRCCRAFTYNSYDREAHFRDSKYLVDNEQCSSRLVKAYKHLLTIPTCIVCKKERHGMEKWGVPLCNTIECHSEWMFNSNRQYLRLAAELLMQVKKAEFVARERAKSEEAKKPRPYCDACKMFVDNPVHGQMHEGNPMFINCTSQGADGIQHHLVWCNMCRMYTNNINHDAVHGAMSRGGKLIGEA